MPDTPIPISPTFQVGDRVQLQLDLSHELGEFPAGAKGRVSHVAHPPEPRLPVGRVRLDEPFPWLDNWENELQVWLPEDGEITWASFKLVEA